MSKAFHVRCPLMFIQTATTQQRFTLHGISNFHSDLIVCRCEHLRVFLRSYYCFARVRLNPLVARSMIVSRLAIVIGDFVVCCYQVTKVYSTRYGFAIASSAWGPCNFGPFTDLSISVFREMSINTVLTQILTSLECGF